VEVVIALAASAASLAIALIADHRQSRNETAAREKFTAEMHQRQNEQRAELMRHTQQLKHELEMQESRLRTELKTEFMAEETINRLLTTREPQRSFEAIRRRIGGFGDQELRRLLVRAGAVRFEGRDDTEFWGLPERNPHD
jgi:hypothetical protein